MLSSSGDPRLEAELRALYSRIDYERTTGGKYSNDYPGYFKLDSMRALLEQLGNPQDQYSIVHVAGTKGKGSVCQMIAGSLRSSGIVTGRYSSPHILQINERIEMNGRPIDDPALATALATVREATDRLAAGHPELPDHSFFEVITATALLYFARQSAEYVVLEVGLGGRLDSTNVCLPQLCVITNISLDHTRQLGSVVDKIAREKAGIIKREIPVVSGAIHPLAAREIRESSAVHNAPLLELNRDFEYQITDFLPEKPRLTVTVSGVLPGDRSTSRDESGKKASPTGPRLEDSTNWQMPDLSLDCAGHHQAENAAIAVAALQVLARSDPRITTTAIREGLSNFHLPGRCEVLSRHPLVVVDMAHNVASVEALVTTLQQLTRAGNPAIRRLIFATSVEKDLAGMLRQLLPEFDEVVFTRFLLNPRATAPEKLLEVARQLVPDPDSGPVMSLAETPAQAWHSARPGQQDLVCVAGSAFLVAELRPLVIQSLGSASAMTDVANPMASR